MTCDISSRYTITQMRGLLYRAKEIIDSGYGHAYLERILIINTVQRARHLLMFIHVIGSRRTDLSGAPGVLSTPGLSDSSFLSGSAVHLEVM